MVLVGPKAPNSLSYTCLIIYNMIKQPRVAGRMWPSDHFYAHFVDVGPQRQTDFISQGYIVPLFKLYEI